MIIDHAVVTYQLQAVASVSSDVLHDVTVGHPLGGHREFPILEGVGNSDETENVGMTQVLPHDNLFAEALHNV